MDSMELKIAICDDMKNDSDAICQMVHDILDTESIPHKIFEYEQPKQLLTAIEKGEQFGLLLLDVMMDEMNGIELAKVLREQNNQTTIIFISGNREMAMYGYEVSAVRFLSKPLEESKVREALLFCLKNWREKKEILLPTTDGQRRTTFSSIQYVEAFDRGVRFVLDKEIVESRMKFSEAQELLPKTMFTLCHRSYLVNLSFVKCIRTYEFVLKDDIIIPISKRRYVSVRKEFVTYLVN